MKGNSWRRDDMHHNRVLVKQKVICTMRPSLFCLFFLLLVVLLLLLLRTFIAHTLIKQKMLLLINCHQHSTERERFPHESANHRGHFWHFPHLFKQVKKFWAFMVSQDIVDMLREQMCKRLWTPTKKAAWLWHSRIVGNVVPPYILSNG